MNRFGLARLAMFALGDWHIVADHALDHALE